MKSFRLFLLFLPFIMAGCQDGVLSHQINNGHLIGGTPANSNEYRSTVSVVGNCTATKIGERTFITAAHCLISHESGELKDIFQSGAKVVIKTHYLDPISVTIDEAHLHESYRLFVIESIENKLELLREGILSVLDIGIFKINEETPEIPVAKIRKEAIKGKEEIIIGGWGCEESYSAYFDYSLSRFKINEQEAFVFKNVEDLEPEVAKVYDHYYFITLSKSYQEDSASLCPGDSGGPVYLKSDGSLVGVNSRGLFGNRDHEYLLNSHARVGVVSEWIQGLID